MGRNAGGMKRSWDSRRLGGSAFVASVVIVGVVAAGVVTVAAPSGAVPAWSVAPSPSPFWPSPDSLLSVSCVSATSCFAVGSKYKVVYNHSPGVVVERWDGRTWSVMTSPGPAGGP